MKTKYSHIIPECYVDTNVVQILMQIKGVNHQYSCGQVTNTMQKVYQDEFSIGIVDNDKKQSNYSMSCVEIARSNEIILSKHPDSPHYLIKVRNLMETFIINCLDSIGLTLKQIGIDGDLSELKKITKDQDSLNNPRLRSLIKLVGNASEMRLLADVLNYLDSMQYNSKESDLKALFSKYGF